MVLLQKTRRRRFDARRGQRRTETAGYSLLLKLIGPFPQLILGFARGLVIEQDMAGVYFLLAVFLKALFDLYQVPTETRLHRLGNLAGL